jgi:hypothetical protein
MCLRMDRLSREFKGKRLVDGPQGIKGSVDAGLLGVSLG